jgi:hypothetical protein
MGGHTQKSNCKKSIGHLSREARNHLAFAPIKSPTKSRKGEKRKLDPNPSLGKGKGGTISSLMVKRFEN